MNFGQTLTRFRRGKVVEIPEKWRGRLVHEQTIRQRDSKRPQKRRKERVETDHFSPGHPRTWAPRHSPKRVCALHEEDA